MNKESAQKAASEFFLPSREEQLSFTEWQYAGLRADIQILGYVLYNTLREPTGNDQKEPRQQLTYLGNDPTVAALTEEQIPYQTLYNPRTKQWEIYLDAQNYMDWKRESTETTVSSEKKAKSAGIDQTFLAAGVSWFEKNPYDSSPIAEFRETDLSKLQTAARILKGKGILFFIAFNPNEKSFGIHIPPVRDETKESIIKMISPQPRETVSEQQHSGIPAVATSVQADVIAAQASFDINALLNGKERHKEIEVLNNADESATWQVDTLATQARKIARFKVKIRPLVRKETKDESLVGHQYHIGKNDRRDIYRLMNLQRQTEKVRFIFVIASSEPTGGSRYYVDLWIRNEEEEKTPTGDQSNLTKEHPEFYLGEIREQLGLTWDENMGDLHNDDYLKGGPLL